MTACSDMVASMHRSPNYPRDTPNGASCGAISPRIQMRIGKRRGAFCRSVETAKPLTTTRALTCWPFPSHLRTLLPWGNPATIRGKTSVRLASGSTSLSLQFWIKVLRFWRATFGRTCLERPNLRHARRMQKQSADRPRSATAMHMAKGGYAPSCVGTREGGGEAP